MKEVYHLDNLADAVALEKPARLAVIGFPIGHSASPKLHQAALDDAELPISYIRLEVEPGQVSKALHRMRDLGFVGCNVTVPHKKEALAACDHVTVHADTVGAVNTICFNDEISGSNTDGPGFSAAIQSEFGLGMDRIHTVVLGAGGGAGQAIATQCLLGKPSRISLVNRSLGKIEMLASKLQRISPETKIDTCTLASPALREFISVADLIVQTTSLGLKETDPGVIPPAFFHSRLCAYDTIYQPAQTPFLRSAQAAGCTTANGLSLLIHQGALAFQSWFPHTNPLPSMLNAMNFPCR